MYVSRLDSRDEFEYLEAVSSSIVSVFRLVHGLDLHETSVTEWIYLDVASSGTRSRCPLHCIIRRGPGRQEEERFFVAFCAPSPSPIPVTSIVDIYLDQFIQFVWNFKLGRYNRIPFQILVNRSWEYFYFSFFFFFVKGHRVFVRIIFLLSRILFFSYENVPFST